MKFKQIILTSNFVYKKVLQYYNTYTNLTQVVLFIIEHSNIKAMNKL